MTARNPKTFNTVMRSFRIKHGRKRSFCETCDLFDLEPLESSEGHLVASDGDSYGAHLVMGPAAGYVRAGCWGTMVENGSITDLWSVHRFWEPYILR